MKPDSGFQLRLATYNLHNLFDAFDDPEKRDHTAPKPARKQAAAAEVIRRSEADVISLQEVENRETLDDFCREHDLADLYPYRVLEEGNDGRGIDVAVLSKYPITEVESHKDHDLGQDRRFRRDLLEVDVELPRGPTLKIFAGHFIRQGNRWLDDYRKDEAQAARTIIVRETEGHPYYALMGDLNDGPGSRTLALLMEDGCLHHTSAAVPSSWGHWRQHKERFGLQSFDHILSSHALHKTHQGSTVISGREAFTASDHLLVHSDFLLAP